MLKKLIKDIFWILGGGYRPRSFWDKWSHTFMDDPWQVAIHKQHMWLLSRIQKEKPKKILEVGCGFGRNIKFLIENKIPPHMIAGIDISKNMIKKAAAYVSDKRVRLDVGLITKLPYKSSSFDLVFTHGVLMHVPPKDIERAIQELIRVSKKTIICIEQNYGGNKYTFIHDYQKLFKANYCTIVELQHHKKLGLDYYYVKVR